MNEQNIKFSTPIQIPPFDQKLDYANRFMLLGSCFSEHIGNKLQQAYFRTLSNPFGILYNPASIAQCLQWIQGESLFSAADLVQHDGLWHSMAHHGDFSHPVQSDCLQHINEKLQQARAFAQKADVLLLTLGTAWVYEMNGRIVGNCHKMPAARFVRRRLTVDEVVNTLLPVLKASEAKQIIFTVSPVRHWKDGAHGNQLSKSILLLAIDELCQRDARCSYFPAYEILMDELRDYRFYADDMLHPSTMAVEYVWQRFTDTFFAPNTRQQMDELLQLRDAINHRPLHPDSASYQKFAAQTAAKLARLKQQFPWLED